MIDLTQERDVETLRQVSLLLERENQRLITLQALEQRPRRLRRCRVCRRCEQFRPPQVAALFYTLCETAKLVGIDPDAYLLHALHAAIATPGAITYPEDRLTPQPA